MTDITQTPEPVTPAVPVEPVDDFAAAFADLNSPAPAPTPTPAPAHVVADPVVVDPANPPAGSALSVPEPASSTPAAAPVSPAPDAPSSVSLEAFQALEARIAELTRAPAAPAPAPAPTPAPVEAPLYTADEAAVLQKYHTDWSDVAQGEALQRRGEYQALVKHVLTEIQPLVNALQDLQGRVPALESTTQYSELVKAIPDYDDVRDPAIEWVSKQPDYLKTAYESVTAHGTPDQIADLIDRFRKETGWVAPTTAPAALPASAASPAPVLPVSAATPSAALPAAAAAAASSLKPVKVGRTEPTTAADPNDFDAGWKAYTADSK